MNTYNRYKNDRDLAWKIILDTGIRNLRKYVNEYAASDLAAVDTARKLVTVEDNLKDNIAMYL